MYPTENDLISAIEAMEGRLIELGDKLRDEYYHDDDVYANCKAYVRMADGLAAIKHQLEDIQTRPSCAHCGSSSVMDHEGYGVTICGDCYRFEESKG